MPIQVVCPSCKTSFKVSDQFAGKQGPCPKCKTPIRVPKLEAPATAPASAGAADGTKKAAAAPVEVKIHEPDATGPKTSTGRPVVKPILRKETKLRAVPVAIVSCGTLLAFAAAWILRRPLQDQVLLRGLGLLAISLPLSMAGYWFLRDDELEPYRGRALVIRASLCALVYAALWAGYALVPADATAAVWNWLFVGPPFFIVGAAIAYATLDLEVGDAFFHYAFYVLVSLALGFAAGLPMPWQAVSRPPAARSRAVGANIKKEAQQRRSEKNRGEIAMISPRSLVKPFADCDGGVAARRTRIGRC